MKNKEPIKLRKKKLANGGYSLYLDYYINGKRTFEFLKLYLNPQTDPTTKAKNRSAMEAAKTIQAKRLIAYQQSAAGIMSTDKRLMKMSTWMDKVLESKADMSKSYISTLYKTRDLWIEYAGEMVKVSDIDADMLRGFARFMKRYDATASKKMVRLKGRCTDSYSNGTRKDYFVKIGTFLNSAAKDGIIAHNPMFDLSDTDKPQVPHAQREYLTMEELEMLARTECRHEMTKRMFMFCCFCGVRYSDCCTVTWKMIDHLQIRTMQTKTKKEVIVPLTDNALQWLPQRNGAPADAFVFSGHHGLVTINTDIHRWVKAAGIDKHISFHCSRHTFATLLITYGADLYTTSKLLGHSSIAVTEIYAKVIDRKKQEAVSLIPSLDILK